MERNDVYNLAYQKANAVAAKYGVDAATLAGYLTAIAKKESGWDENAKNKSSSARGLMQILICTQREVEKKRAKIPFAPASYSCKNYPTDTVDADSDQMYNPDYAMEIAAYELGYQFKRYQNWNKAIHSYNQGHYSKSNSAGNSYAASVGNIYNDVNNPELAYNEPTTAREFY